MKLWKLITFLTVSVLIFSGCVAQPKPKVIVDSTLPVVTLTKEGIVTDMKAVGFEWKSVMQDSRVEGIYVYKKALKSEEKLNEFYDTIKNRFVTHYLDENVKPATEYSYVFKTFTKESESVPSNEIIVKTLPILKSVSWIHVVQELPRSAKLLWRPHTNQIVESYIIERKTLADNKWKKLEHIDGRLSAEYIDTNLKNNHVYMYRIRAVTYNDIISTPSQEVKVLTKALPASVDNIVASTDIAKQIKLTWNKTTIQDFAHYNIYRSRSIDGSYEFIHTTKTTEFIDEIPEDGKDYFYRVSVVDTDDLESKYDIKSIHGKTLIKPLTPSLVGVKMVDNNLEINWDSKDPRVKSFVVEKIVKLSWIDQSKEEFIDITGKSFIDTKIAPNTTYYYKIYAVDAFSVRSEPSIEVKFTTKASEGQAVEKVIPKVIEKEKNVVKPMDDISVSSEL